MAKRIIVSTLMVLLVLVLAYVGASFLFSNSYDNLNRQTSAQEESSLPAELPAQEPGNAAAAVPNAPTGAAASTPEEVLAGMTPEEKICQLLFVTPEVLTGQETVTAFNEEALETLARYPVGGLIFFRDNLETAKQTRSMLSAITEKAGTLTAPGIFLGLDEEGGSVSRATHLGVTEYEDMKVYGGNGDPETAYEIGQTLGAQLKQLGFNLDFAPVADVLTNEENTVVADRSFGSDPELVSDMVSREIAGFEDAGMLSSPKHFPGHGSTSGDTHDGLAATDRSLEELRACDFLPFRAAMEAGAPMIMVGHMTMTALDEDTPASMSQRIVTDLLRKELDFDGIIITDAVDMDAISERYSAPEAVVQALAAGCDMVLCPTNLPGVINAVQNAITSGTLSQGNIDQSVLRILSAKFRYGVISS